MSESLEKQDFWFDVSKSPSEVTWYKVLAPPPLIAQDFGQRERLEVLFRMSKLHTVLLLGR